MQLLSAKTPFQQPAAELQRGSRQHIRAQDDLSDDCDASGRLFDLKEKDLWKTHKALSLNGLHSGFRAPAAGCDEACQPLRHKGLCYSVVKERLHAS